MHGFFAAPGAELFVFDLALDEFFILPRIIIPPLAHGTAEGDQPVGALYFCHGEHDTAIPGGMQYRCRGAMDSL